MKFLLKMVYTDGKIETVSLTREESDKFFDCVATGKIYWAPDNKAGFWTDINKIRYFQVFEEPETQNEMDIQDKESQGSQTPVEEPPAID